MKKITSSFFWAFYALIFAFEAEAAVTVDVDSIWHDLNCNNQHDVGEPLLDMNEHNVFLYESSDCEYDKNIPADIPENSSFYIGVFRSPFPSTDCVGAYFKIITGSETLHEGISPSVCCLIAKGGGCQYFEGNSLPAVEVVGTVPAICNDSLSIRICHDLDLDGICNNADVPFSGLINLTTYNGCNGTAVPIGAFTVTGFDALITSYLLRGYDDYVISVSGSGEDHLIIESSTSGCSTPCGIGFEISPSECSPEGGCSYNWTSDCLSYDSFEDDCFPLPVELTSFSATEADCKVTLNWSTASELMNRGFFIERFSATVGWKQLGFIKGNGTTATASRYSYVDTGVKQNGSYLYRLKQIDFDGSYEYSDNIAVSVTSCTNQNLRLAVSDTRLEVSWTGLDVTGFRVVDASDREWLGTSHQGLESKQIDISSLPTGIYFLLTETKHLVRTDKFLKIND